MTTQVSIGRIHTPGPEVGRQKSELTGGIHRNYAAGETICDYEDETPRLLFLVSGWAVCSKTLPNGTRIVVEFALRGDMVSTPSVEMARETVQALSDVTAIEFPDFTSNASLDVSPRLYRIVLAEMMRRQARMSERLATIGRRDALERTGHLLLELATRIGPSRKKPGFDGFECPLTQADIGDAVGLSTVHINRVLRDMRMGGLLSFRNGIVEFLDRNRLVELVDFDETYFAPHMI
ncbi:MAG: Crp/Fnr family transcriptional regulator [Rhizobiaceae bacterium]|nr:Crp/Fnr family transcriptional regulator [Rhizobiaceae bacterium]